MRKFYLSVFVLGISATLFAQRAPMQKKAYTQSKKVACTPDFHERNVPAEQRESEPKPNIGISGSAKSMTLWEQVIGYTTYDNQSNNSDQNRIYIDDQEKAFATWTMSFQNNTTWSDRGTGYNSGEGFIWDEIPYDRIEDVRTGWPGIFPTGDGGEAFVCHTGTGPVSMAKRSSQGTGSWTVTTLPSDLGTDFLWPRSVSDGNVIHVIALSAPTGFDGTPVNDVDGNIIYWRSSDNGATWDIQDHIFDEIDPAEYSDIESDSYAIDARDGKVSIAIFSEDHDSAILTSDDGGNNWAYTVFMDFPIPGYVGDQVTDIENDGIIDTMLTTDGIGSMLIDGNGIVHVSFGEFAFFDDTADDSLYTLFLTDRLLYWNSTFDTDEIYVIGTYQESEADNNETNDITFDQAPDYRASLASMSTMGEDEEGNIYVVFAAADELFLGAQVFRHLYVVVSGDGGTTFDAAVELTPDLDGNEYEYAFPSMSRTVGEMMHIVVQRDFEPGLIVRGDLDDSEENDIVYLAVTADLDITPNVGELETIPSFDVYPNPSNGNVTIAGENLGGLTLKVYDKMGREMINTRINKSFNSKDSQSFDFSTLPAGTYTIALINGNQKMSKEIVIK